MVHQGLRVPLTLRRGRFSIDGMVWPPPGWALAGTAAIALLGTAAAAAQTRDEVVARAIDAQGGPARLRATKTRVTTGTISFDGAAANPFTVEQKRPNRLRMEIFFPAGVLLRGYDGQTGWQASPFAARREAQPLSAEETRGIAEEAEFDDALLDWRARGSAVELVGKEQVDGRPAFRLRVTARDGLTQEILLDAESYLKVRWEGARPVNGTTTLFASSFSDFRTVEGVKLPFRIASRAQGSQSRQEIVISGVELNGPLDDARFSLPKPAEKPEPRAGSAKP